MCWESDSKVSLSSKELIKLPGTFCTLPFMPRKLAHFGPQIAFVLEVFKPCLCYNGAPCCESLGRGGGVVVWILEESGDFEESEVKSQMRQSRMKS